MIAVARDRVVLGLIVLAYFGLAVLYATRVPIWNAPDEPAHFNYVKSIAVEHRLPTLQMGDYDQALLERLTNTRFPPDQSIAMLRYESHQPPLYYVVAAPVLAATQHANRRTQVVALRLVTVAIGALFILAVFHLASLIFPRSPSLPLAAAAFVAFIPMHLFMDAAIDNDALAELMLCLTLIVAVEDLRGKRDSRADVRAGVVAGLAILTKLVAGVAVVLVAIGFLGAAFLASDRRRAFRALPLRLARSGAVTLALSGWWVVRNLVVYGWKDPFGLRRHAEVVAGQLPTGGLSLTLARQMLLTLFHSFWGQFGWMGVPFADRTYDAIAAGSVPIVVGMILFGWRMVKERPKVAPFARGDGSGKKRPRSASERSRSTAGYDPHPDPLPEGEGTTRPHPDPHLEGEGTQSMLSGGKATQRQISIRRSQPGPLSPLGEGQGEGRTPSIDSADVLTPWQRWALGLLVAEVLLVVVGVVFYNLHYLQPQGRYLFPTLPALAIFAAAGITELVRERYVGIVLVLAGLALTWLAVFSLFDVIGPAFAS